MALEATKLSFPCNAVEQFGVRIFVYALQYHWHTSGTARIDQEARELDTLVWATRILCEYQRSCQYLLFISCDIVLDFVH